MFRPSRNVLSGGTDPFLPWKVRTFFVGAVLAMAGLATGVSWLAAAAIAVLGAGLALRFASRRRAWRRTARDAEALDERGTREPTGPPPEGAPQAASGVEETKRP